MKMKKLILMIPILFMFSCGGTMKDIEAEDDIINNWNEVTFKNHTYVKCDNAKGVSILHSPDCKCKNK